MIGLVKENASNISNNIIADNIYVNENSKLQTVNSQSQKNERKKTSKKNKTVGDSAFRAFASNFMSLFGYGDTAQSVHGADFSEMPIDKKSSIGRQNLSDIMGVQHNRNETVAVGTDVEDDSQPSEETQTINSKSETNNSAMTSLNSENILNHVYKLTSKNTETVSKLVSEKKSSSNSQLQIIAHVSGRPVHAKYSYGKNKFKVSQTNVEQANLKHSENNKEKKPITSNTPNFNSILVPSPIMQFRQVPVQVVGQQHQIVYNTPLITQRVIPQTNKIIYQPIYTHMQAEMGSNGLPVPVGHGIMRRNICSQESFVGASTEFSGKELFGTYSAGVGAKNILPNTNSYFNNSKNNQIIGFGTPLASYRSMSHIPSNSFINMDSNQTSGAEFLDVNQETRLQSSNEVATNSLCHPRNGTAGSVLSAGSACPPISSFGVGIPVKVVASEEKMKRKENPSSNKPQSSKQIVRTNNGNIQNLSLTTTTSSDTGSVTMSNNSINNAKTTLEKNPNVNADTIKSSSEKHINIPENVKIENEYDQQKGFIPQASPVVNYRSTLDYLVTPMVRYRDIASNLKVRTVPPQLSSNDACKYVTTETPGNCMVDSSNGSNSPRNMNTMDSNDYKETVYTPVAPFPPMIQNYSMVPGRIENLGAIEKVNYKSQSNGNLLVNGTEYIDNSLTKQANTLNATQGSNPMNGVIFHGGPQGGRIFDGGLNSHIYGRAPVGVPQNLGYRLVRTASKNYIGSNKAPSGGGVSIYKENYIREENVSYNKNQNTRKGYVNKMYQYLADSSQFPPLPKEIYVDDIEFLTRPISSETNSNKMSNGETNVSLVKGSTPGKGREWDSINRGTFCTVYKVRHGECVAAVKCPQKRIHDSDPLMSRYRCYTEWKLLYRCNRHPNILNLVGGIRINEYEIWLVTEYIRTGDLFKLIHGNSSRSKAFRESVEHRYKVMYQLADSIRFLHSLSPKIVHKDLKSNNILIDENYNIRICDFGDAEELHYNVITCCTAVTWQYAPPEIVGCSDPARPNSNANEKVDVWSMGCIFLEILCKRTPLQHILDKIDESGKHSTLYNLIHSNKIEGELKIPPLPDSLYNLITMCLRPNPELRSSSKEVFDYLVNNEKKIMKQLSHINQYKMSSGHSNLKNQNNFNTLTQFKAV